MLAEIGSGHRERNPVRRRTRDVNWKAERNRRRTRITRHDCNAVTRSELRRIEASLVGRAGWELLEVAPDVLLEPLRVASSKTEYKVHARVMGAIEGAHVLQRELLQRPDRPAIVMSVWMSGVNDVVEVFLTELLVIALSQRDLEEIERIVAQSREVLLPEPRVEDHVPQQAVVLVKILDVRGAGKDGHLLVDLPVHRRRYRVHRVNDLLICHRARATFGEHGRGQ